MRADAGSPLYGEISAVFSPGRMREVALLSAVDTGSFEGMCNYSGNINETLISSLNESANPLQHNCSAFPWGPHHLGTMDHFNHLMLISEAYWNNTVGLSPMLSS